jgi:hypothetical protein
VNDAGTASAASTERIGTSAAISVGTCDVCRSAAIRAATPSCPLITPPNTCMLDARYRTRRATVPPAAGIVRCHASLRETSAPICSSTVATSTHESAAESASANSCRRPESAHASTAAVAREPTTVMSPRRRRPKRRTQPTSSPSEPPMRGRCDVAAGSRPCPSRLGSSRSCYGRSKRSDPLPTSTNLRVPRLSLTGRAYRRTQLETSTFQKRVPDARHHPTL